MCGAPANTHGWINSGTQNNVILSNMSPNTLFYYNFGSPGQVSLQRIVNADSEVLGNYEIRSPCPGEPAGHRQGRSGCPGQVSLQGVVGESVQQWSAHETLETARPGDSKMRGGRDSRLQACGACRGERGWRGLEKPASCCRDADSPRLPATTLGA